MVHPYRSVLWWHFVNMWMLGCINDGRMVLQPYPEAKMANPGPCAIQWKWAAKSGEGDWLIHLRDEMLSTDLAAYKVPSTSSACFSSRSVRFILLVKTIVDIILSAKMKFPPLSISLSRNRHFIGIWRYWKSCWRVICLSTQIRDLILPPNLAAAGSWQERIAPPE